MQLLTSVKKKTLQSEAFDEFVKQGKCRFLFSPVSVRLTLQSEAFDEFVKQGKYRFLFSPVSVWLCYS